MQITSIVRQKKEGRYNIYIDNEFRLGAYEDTILKFGLRSKDEITEEKIKEIKEYDEFNFGKTVAYRLLSYRQRSEKELTDKLKGKKIETENVTKVINKLKNLKFIDDKNFAKNFVLDQINKKPTGKKLISYKLLQKGIDKKTAEETLSENYSTEQELKNAELLLGKYYAKVKGKNEQDKKRKCYSYLLTRGFTYSIITETFENFFSGG